jgi:hypothetical protein
MDPNLLPTVSAVPSLSHNQSNQTPEPVASEMKKHKRNKSVDDAPINDNVATKHRQSADDIPDDLSVSSSSGSDNSSYSFGSSNSSDNQDALTDDDLAVESFPIEETNPSSEPGPGNQAIIDVVKRLSRRAAKVMVSDPVPQHLGITSEEYEQLKKKEAKNFKKMNFCVKVSGKFAIRDTISVQLQHDYVNDDEEHEEESPPLQDFLIPHHSVHIETAEEQVEKKEKDSTTEDQPPEQRPSTLTRPCQSILHRPTTCPSRFPEKKGSRKRHVTFDKVIIRE